MASKRFEHSRRNECLVRNASFMMPLLKLAWALEKGHEFMDMKRAVVVDNMHAEGAKSEG